MAKRYSMGKVKRYRHSFYSGRMYLIKKVASFVLLIAAVFVVGFLVAPSVLDWGTHLWYTQIKGVDLDSSTAASSTSTPAASDAASEPAASQAPAPTPAAVITDGTWATVSLAGLNTPESIEQTAQTLAGQGVNYAMVTLKDSSGYVTYASGVANAARSIAATTIDASATAAALKANGITPVACICAFRDPIACYTDREMAIRYTGSDYLWLDAAADAGGKPWLSPYSDMACAYIGDLIEEAYSMGYEQVILSAVQFPSYVSAKQDFGDTAGRDRAAQLALRVSEWNTRFASNVTIWYEVPYSDCVTAGTDLGEQTPDLLGVQNLVIRMPQQAEPADSASSQTPVDGGAAAQAMKNGGCANVLVRDNDTFVCY